MDWLLLNLACAWWMTGLIWTIQILHYPLMRRIGKVEFVNWHEGHLRLVSGLVVPVMLLEVVTAGAGWWTSWREADGYGAGWATGMGLLGVIWVSTLAVQAPAHGRLREKGWQDREIRWLVATNWVRTVAWSGRAILLLGMTWSAASR